MSKQNICLLLSAAVMIGCVEKFDSTKVYDNQTTSNAEYTLGITIDPNQTWSAIRQGTVTIAADTDMDDIAEVQVLSESPFGNPDARVLNRIDCRKGDRVTLTYEAPDYIDKLIAACVSSEGIYYVKVFGIGQQNVSFANASAKARTRAESGLPEASSLVIKRSVDSFNKQRADNGYGLWAGSGWNDRFYALDDGMEQKLIQGAANFTAEEKQDLQAIFDAYLQRDAKKVQKSELINGRPDNLGKILASGIFSMGNNYLTLDGNMLTLTPVEMASFETREGCWLYYFYYDPAIMAGKSDAEQVQILKQLPKYKAIQCWRLGSKVGNGKTYGESEIFREMVFICPYYGDDEPVVGKTCAEAYSIPAGYNIGLVQRMMKDGSYTNTKMGELYGDGRLNNEINQLAPHFTSAQLGPGDPRQAIFSANGRTYVTFEDGSDRQFSDMILEIGSGIEEKKVEEPQSPEAAAYTMCFEDRPHTADYDMNDVVLQARRVNAHKIQISLLACGAEDKVVLRGIEGSRLLNNREIHDIFGLDEDDSFVNTKIGGLSLNPMSEVIETGDLTIEQYLRNIYIENTTTGQTIGMPDTGKAPYAIIVPVNFNYPMEGQSIKVAYPEFLDWAQNQQAGKGWYTYGTDGKIYPNPF